MESRIIGPYRALSDFTRRNMKNIICLIIVISTIGNNTGLFAQAIKKSEETTYKNPLPVVFGDPYVLYVKGDKYYMYGTGGATHGFAAYSSIDLVHWKSEGQVWFANNKNGWSDSTAGWDGAYWAPEVYEVKGSFICFTAPNGKLTQTKSLKTFTLVLLLRTNRPGHLLT